MEPSLHSISVVVPVYSNGTHLPPLCERLVNVLSISFASYEIILVDDCFPGESWSIIMHISSDNPNIKGVKLARNYGQHNATLCGVRLANSDYIATLDDDLQHPPESLPRLAAALSTDCDLVWGIPFEMSHGLIRRLSVKITKFLLSNWLKLPYASQVSSFRVFKRSLINSFAHYDGTWAQLDLLLTWSTSSVQSIPVNHHKRKSDSSTYDLRRLLAHAWNLIVGFTTLPLRIATYIGFFVALFSVILLAYLFMLKLLYGSVVPGFLFISCLIAIFSAVQFFFLGVLGEYVARIHLGVVGKLSYTVRRTINFKE